MPSAMAEKTKNSLKGSLANFQKLAEKIEKEDEDLIKKMKSAISAAKEAAESGTSGIIGLPGQIKLIQENFDKKVPAQAIKTSTSVVAADTKKFGSTITTAESTNDNPKDFLKKKDDLYLPEARNLIEEVETYSKKMSSDLPKARKVLNNAVGNLREFGAALKSMAS